MSLAYFPPRALRGLRVLMVEDDALVAMLLEDWLLDAGARMVGPAWSVAEGLALIAGAESDGGLDAAVLDIRLMGGEVAPVADRLAGLAVPFVFITGWDGGAARAVHAAAPVLMKPFHPDALVAAIARLPDRARATRAERRGACR